MGTLRGGALVMEALLGGSAGGADNDLEQKRRVWSSLAENLRRDAISVQRRDVMRRLKDNYVPKVRCCARFIRLERSDFLAYAQDHADSLETKSFRDRYGDEDFVSHLHVEEQTIGLDFERCGRDKGPFEVLEQGVSWAHEEDECMSAD